ncbi:MAG: cyclic nucleotide-binding domain-containing protein [Nitrospinaceae bacterium]|nr:cyclic nucleotide-binding domain-containing protein [Nitrospinaceae bacterium]NIR54143.1 cyclic nucleotide-binding domain-containing protein [Nitrospinaceae bacterium]NIS84557.1 cyclic nucleotide-binding domain-containing protein [Nitrospinaceae bacterium]NIT81349.1 cyclic nucleotide-binding domain-containing protein [Nitrospinaceae bacterium]NIU43636.1 cyclic nucleotide-binding domain-containing protein [Nitrospinaceae bacterium]
MGETIFDQGSVSDCAYIIESGSVEILEKQSDGEYRLIEVLKPNEIFGEMGVIDGLPRSATARAREDSHIFVLTRDAFHHMAQSKPEVMVPILKVLVSRLRQTMGSMAGTCRPARRELHRV